MNQRAFLQEFDEAAFDAFREAGIADAATYLPPDAAPGAVATPCVVAVDQGVQDVGEDLAPVSAPFTRVSFQRAEVEPAFGGQVTITASGVALRLVRRVRQDESQSAWQVEHV